MSRDGVSGELRPARGVAIVQESDVVYAASLPDGPIVVLEGSAAVIWDELMRGGSGSIAERVADATGASLDSVRADVDAFVEQLIGLGMVSRPLDEPARRAPAILERFLTKGRDHGCNEHARADLAQPADRLVGGCLAVDTPRCRRCARDLLSARSRRATACW